MNKKAYIIPDVFVQEIKIQQMICDSIASLGGDTEITPGSGDPEPPSGGDSRRKSIWDDEDDY